MKRVMHSPSAMDSIALERSALSFPLLMTPAQVCRFQASNGRSYDAVQPREGASFLGDSGTKMITLLPALIKAWLNESRFLRCSVAEILWVNHRRNPCVLTNISNSFGSYCLWCLVSSACTIIHKSQWLCLTVRFQISLFWAPISPEYLFSLNLRLSQLNQYNLFWSVWVSCISSVLTLCGLTSWARANILNVSV